jgi:hypothetical protein
MKPRSALGSSVVRSVQWYDGYPHMEEIHVPVVDDERALIRDGLLRGMGEITHVQVRANLDARLASGEFQIVERLQGVPGRQFTTARTIEAEYEILRRMREGQNSVEPVLSRPHAINIADQHPHLNRAQKSVARRCQS